MYYFYTEDNYRRDAQHCRTEQNYKMLIENTAATCLNPNTSLKCNRFKSYKLCKFKTTTRTSNKNTYKITSIILPLINYYYLKFV